MKNSLTAVRGGLTRAACCVMLAACLGGCTVRKPTLKLRDIEVAGMDFQQVLLILDVAVTNPNDYQISLHGLDYTLTAGNEQLIAGSMPRPVTPLTALQTTVVKAPMSLKYRQLLPLVKQAGAGKEIPYELVVTATFDFIAFKMKVPMKRAGVLPALLAPSWRFRDLRIAGGVEPTAELVFEVINPNSFALPLSKLSGTLDYADKTLLRIDQPSLNSVPAGETARITVRVKLDAAEVLKAMTEALANRGQLQFKGNLSIDPPVALHEMLLEGLAKDD